MAVIEVSRFDDEVMSKRDKALVRECRKRWADAKASGDAAGMEIAHSAAEQIRSKYGYSGGADGSGYIPLGTAVSRVGSAGTNRAAVGDYDLSEAGKYINDMYDMKIAAARAALEAAYERNVQALGAKRTAIPAKYQAAKNAAASRAEVRKRSFNEYAAARGLDAGAGGQAALAFETALQEELGSLDRAQSDELAGIDRELAALKARLRSDLIKAAAEGNMERAAALLKNYESARSRLLSGS